MGVLLLVPANPAPAPFQELNGPRLSDSHAVRSDGAKHRCMCCYVCKGHDAGAQQGVVGIGVVAVAAGPARTFEAFLWNNEGQKYGITTLERGHCF